MLNEDQKEYHRQKSREHYNANYPKYKERIQQRMNVVRQYIRDAKRTGCSRCGETHTACIDFHHLHGKDKIISKMWSYSLKRVQDEISKCILLCANCHRKEHYPEDGVISSDE